MSGPVEVRYWAEGPTDRAMARRLIRAAGGMPGADFAQRRRAAPGKDRLDHRLAAFNAAARFAPWLILRDGDGECAAELKARLLPRPAPLMLLRIVVPSLEAWLLADREAFADLLGIAPAVVPSSPEQDADPEQTVLALANRSRSRDLRRDFLPADRSGRRIGPGYSSRLIEFIDGPWEPDRAARSAPSLRRALARLRELIPRVVG